MIYKLVTAIDDKTLQKRVNDAIKEGWRPLGGLCVYDNPWSEVGGKIYNQAMTRLDLTFAPLSIGTNAT